MFKDLKQILRKEQCDASILLTANVPSAKKIIVHGPQGKKCLLQDTVLHEELILLFLCIKQAKLLFGMEICDPLKHHHNDAYTFPMLYVVLM
jgi:hypothetical protein